MPQGILRMVDLQVDPEMLVGEVHLTSVPVVAVLDPDDRLAEVGDVEQEPFLDLLETPGSRSRKFLGLLIILEAENRLCRRQKSGVRKVSTNVTSLWIRRTSKIFSRPRPRPFVPLLALFFR